MLDKKTLNKICFGKPESYIVESEEYTGDEEESHLVELEEDLGDIDELRCIPPTDNDQCLEEQTVLIMELVALLGAASQEGYAFNDIGITTPSTCPLFHQIVEEQGEDVIHSRMSHHFILSASLNNCTHR